MGHEQGGRACLDSKWDNRRAATEPLRERFDGRQQGGDWLPQIWRDHVHAVRRLSKNLAFTTVVAMTLALAIGGNAAIFSVVSGVLLKPLPYPDPDRLVRVFAQHPRFGEVPLTPVDFHALREHKDGLRRCRGLLPRRP